MIILAAYIKTNYEFKYKRNCNVLCITLKKINIIFHDEKD